MGSGIYSTVVMVVLVLLAAYFIIRRMVRKTSRGRVGERRKEIIERMRHWNESRNQDDDNQPGQQNKSGV
jgi:uncharacterized membrane protein YhiD involved in acid resistance